MNVEKLTEKDFSTLFNLHYEELCRIVYPILKDVHAAEDIVQDVYVKVWLRKEELTVTTNYKAYLYKAVVYRALDYLRKQKSTVKVKEELKVIHNLPHQEPDSTMEETQLLKAIDSVLEKMPENMRLIFHLSRFSNLKNREIAEQLNISIKTVESNISKALKLMRDHLKPYINNSGLMMILGLMLMYLLKK